VESGGFSLASERMYTRRASQKKEKKTKYKKPAHNRKIKEKKN
jgi:hypothetical protein